MNRVVLRDRGAVEARQLPFKVLDLVGELIEAEAERGGEWRGKAYMCTRDREFRIEGRENCLVRGYDRTGFFEVDTGKDAKNWTVQLTDANQPQAAR